MTILTRLIRLFVVLALLGCLLGVLAVGGAYLYFAPGLPAVETLRDARLQVPLQVLARDGALVAEFGEKRRRPVTLSDVPPRLVQAFLAAEDDRFFEHPGVDWKGLGRAVWEMLSTGEKRSGGSTITMQVARNFFLSRDKTYERKAREILLALRIDSAFSKEEILELYLNKVFLGQRAYGVGAAAEVYFGKDMAELDLAQMAMIAGLPKAPSEDNPVTNPDQAAKRRAYVLGRMLALGYISQDEYDQARAQPVKTRVYKKPTDVDAPYVAEMVRLFMEGRFGAQAYTEGYKVYTTISPRLQAAANRAVRGALMTYDRRHGYRGPESTLTSLEDPHKVDTVLRGMLTLGELPPAVVVEVEDKRVRVLSPDIGLQTIEWDGLQWARPYVDEARVGPAPRAASDILKVGDVIRLERYQPRADGKGRRDARSATTSDAEWHWRLAQLPAVEGAMVALWPDDGAVAALVGGFDFFRSAFNRATQAERQPGSSFKPFVYSAALEFGYNASSMINDSPVVYDDPSLEDDWRPENYSGKFYGPTRLREALYKSRNLVSIRLLRSIGIDYAVQYALRFGFAPERLPRNLSLALGTATVKPIELASAYAVLANGGFRVEPYFIDKIEDGDGKLVYESSPARVCAECPESQFVARDISPAVDDRSDPATIRTPATSGVGNVAPRVMTAENNWITASLLRDVIQRGTGRAAADALGRKDIAGKTGTTNDQQDAWFSGFTPGMVATAWVGFDKLAPLGPKETGGRAALPAWIDFMRVALDGVEEALPPQPPGVVAARIDPRTGRVLAAGSGGGVVEYFHADRLAGQTDETRTAAGDGSTDRIRERLF
ncbi:MAG: penicillin-binding protein 1A [Gammaproteobacteria bacterium]|nr:penicillin-binding protein 1A [Gammaproteobacteria bacterium]